MKKRIVFLSKNYFQFIFGCSVASYLIVVVFFVYLIGDYPLKYVWKGAVNRETIGGGYVSSNSFLGKSRGSTVAPNYPLFSRAKTRYHGAPLPKVTPTTTRLTPALALGPRTSDFRFLNEDTLVYSGFWDKRRRNSGDSYHVRLMALLRSRGGDTSRRLRNIRFGSFLKGGGNSNNFYKAEDRSTFVCSFIPPSHHHSSHLADPYTLGEVYETCENHRMEWGAFYISCPVPPEFLKSLYSNRTATSIMRSSFYITLHDLKAPDAKTLILINVPRSFGPVKDGNAGNNELDVFDGWSTYRDDSSITNESSAGICVPPLFGNVSAHSILQFMELSRSIGAGMVFFYLTTNDTEAYPYLKVLAHYESLGRATLLPWTLPLAHPPGQIWNYGQSLSIGDCLYRNMYAYDLLAFNDLDEFIVPRSHLTWQTMASDERYWARNVSGIKVRGAFFEMPEERPLISHVYYDANDIPNEGRLLSNVSTSHTPGPRLPVSNVMPRENVMNMVRRTSAASRVRTKCLIKPRLVFEQGIHHMSKQLIEEVVPVEAPADVLLLHHYRKCSRGYDVNCIGYVRDAGVRRYATDFLRGYERRYGEMVRIGII